jgi:hypothetical protein
MAKRTSWEQENKHIHKSRKKIIDTVFGREDNTQSVFGYEAEADVKHEVGEIWTDKDGKTWQQRDGYKISVTKFDDLREYLKTITTCSGKECHTEKYNHIDKKLIAKTTMCLDCLQKYEDGLRADGTWPFYEDYKLTCNKLAFANEMKDKYEGAHRDITNSIEMVNEDGTISEWKWDIDINTVKADIQRDLDNVVDAIKKLKSRKRRLEKKLKELGHPEIINK